MENLGGLNNKTKKRVGGIDLTAADLTLKTQGRASSFVIPELNQEDINQIEGFSPFIFQVLPVKNLQTFLGIS